MRKGPACARRGRPDYNESQSLHTPKLRRGSALPGRPRPPDRKLSRQGTSLNPEANSADPVVDGPTRVQARLFRRRRTIATLPL